MAPALAGMAHARRHKRVGAAPFCVFATGALCLLVAGSRAQPSDGTFFDLFGKPAAAPEDQRKEQPAAAPKVATYAQQKKMLLLLLKSPEVDDRWKTHCVKAGFHKQPLVALAPEFVQEFLVDPANHKANFLKEFLAHAKLDPVSAPGNIDDGGEEHGGSMDSKQTEGVERLKEERRLLARAVCQFRGRGPEEAATWYRFCDRMQDWEDPDDVESRAARSEMSMRAAMGERKTALESFLDAQSGNAPPGSNEWGS